MHLKFIFKRSLAGLYVAVVALGIVNSLSNIGILGLINAVITGRELPQVAGHEDLYFLALLAASVVSNRTLQIILIRLTNNTLLATELALLKKLTFSSYASFASIGKAKVYTAIEDIETLRAMPALFVSLFNSATIIICGVVYLFVISYVGALVLIGTMMVLGTWYNWRNRKIEPVVRRLRANKDVYYKILQDLIDGFRELKMSSRRTHRIYHEHLKVNREEGKAFRIDLAQRYLSNELFGSYTWYILLGGAVFFFPLAFHLSVGQVAEFVVTILFIMGPVVLLLDSMPAYQTAKVAMQRLMEVERIVSEDDGHHIAGGELDAGFQTLRLEEIRFQYFDKQDKTFALGPVSVDFRRGELVFICGSNGSGKSTFINILTGILPPEGGSILYNGVHIDNTNRAAYRDKFAVVFSPSYLFNKNYTGDTHSKAEAYARYFKYMRLPAYLNEKNYFDYVQKLSGGQKKRLALILAVLEDHDLIVLDEWAAEQDPEFKRFFYHFILPEQKALGKTIIAITHDDHYYAVADRIIKFDYGVMVPANDNTCARVQS